MLGQDTEDISVDIEGVLQLADLIFKVAVLRSKQLLKVHKI